MATQSVYRSGKGTEPASDGREPLADCLVTLVTMAGTVAGAVAGTVVAAEVGSEPHVAWGTLGTLLGGGFAAGLWCLLADLCGRTSVGQEDGHVRDRAAARRVAVEPSAK